MGKQEKWVEFRGSSYRVEYCVGYCEGKDDPEGKREGWIEDWTIYPDVKGENYVDRFELDDDMIPANRELKAEFEAIDLEFWMAVYAAFGVPDCDAQLTVKRKLYHKASEIEIDDEAKVRSDGDKDGSTCKRAYG